MCPGKHAKSGQPAHHQTVKSGQTGEPTVAVFQQQWPHSHWGQFEYFLLFQLGLFFYIYKWYINRHNVNGYQLFPNISAELKELNDK